MIDDKTNVKKKRIVRKLIRVLENRYKIPKTLSKNRFHLLITTILSQRTRDENTARASKQLFSAVKTPHDIVGMKTSELRRLIKPAGMFRQKAKRIKQVSKIIVSRYKGKIPKTREELLALPGVGFKTADIVLSYGYGVPVIAVDTHVNQISKRIGIVDKKSDVEKVRRVLESFVPENKRYIMNLGLVWFGQETCLPRKPICRECPMSSLCDYAQNHQRNAENLKNVCNHIYS